MMGWAAAAAALLAGAAVAWRELRRAEDRLAAARADAERWRAEAARQAELVERLQRSRRAERAFTQQLREELEQARQARRDSEKANVHALVLHAAMELLDARKGLLLAQEDEDGDGDLDLVASRGFDHDPTHSAVAQRFAHEVLDRDATVREDEPPRESARTAADHEIDTLVAVPLYLMDRFHGVVVCANRPGGFESLDDDLLLALGDHAGTALNTQKLQREISDGHRATLRILADTLQARDPELRHQAGEAALLVRALCRRLGVPEREHEVAASAALVRDVGYVGVPERVLAKPGPLTSDERAVMELHPRLGHSLVSQQPALRDVAEAVLYHHERWDGTGYPGGLAGDVIPLPARVLAVVDAYSAMIHARPHRDPLTPEEALAELDRGAGAQFDPELVPLFADEVRASAAQLDTALAAAVTSALDSAGGAGPSRPETPTPDPLTLLPGHRAFREAVRAAGRRAGDGPGFAVALVQLEELGRVNAAEGYAAGDRVVVAAARAAERTAVRLGGSAYRDSGRRLGLLVPAPAAADAAAELHTELAVGPLVRYGVAEWRPGETGDDVVDRARARLGAAVES